MLFLGSRLLLPFGLQRIQLVNTGSGKRILAEGSRQSGADWIFQNVSDDRFSRLIVTKNALVISGLPQKLLGLLPVRESCCLLESLHEGLEVGLLGLSLDERVEMIRHQAIGKNCEVEQRRVMQKLLSYASGNDRIGE